jgi:hypothetical protein
MKMVSGTTDAQHLSIGVKYQTRIDNHGKERP